MSHPLDLGANFSALLSGNLDSDVSEVDAVYLNNSSSSSDENSEIALGIS
jgi:hypothetical protein